jgi:hypothetical protein
MFVKSHSLLGRCSGQNHPILCRSLIYFTITI